MALKEKFFAMLAKLTSEEKAQLKVALADKTEADKDIDSVGEPATDVPAEEMQTNEFVETETDEVEVPDIEEPDEGDAETETDGDATDDAAEEMDEGQLDKAPAAESAMQTAPEATSEQPTDEQGEPVPVDYQDIIDGLNAKILALEAENMALRAKTEGAFGLASKSGDIVKVNPLYDNDTSDIHFQKK